MSDVGAGKRFPTEWHRDRFIQDCERGLAGALTHGAEDEAEGFRKELAAVGVGVKAPAKRASKRPADGDRERRA